MTTEPVCGVSPLLSCEYSAVDLSVLIAEDLPCYWVTHQPFQTKTWNWFADHRHPAGSALSRGGPYATRWMAIDEHTGTHIDAPCHFIPPPGSGLADAGPSGDITVDRVPLRQLMGRCAVIDADLDARATGPGTSPRIEPAVILAWEDRNGRLDGEIVLLRTGWDRHYRRGGDGLRYLHDVIVTGRETGWPALSVAAVELLLERGVRCIGVDAPSAGPAEDARPVHVRALNTGAVFIECLTGLGQLPARGAWFCFLPLRLEGGTGSPGRAIALLAR